MIRNTEKRIRIKMLLNQCLSKAAGTVRNTYEHRCLSRLASPVFVPLGEPSVCPAWRAQCLSRLASPVFVPLGEPSVCPAWRAQCLSRLGKDTFVKILSCFNRLWFLNITMIPQTFPMFLYQRNIYKNEENHVVDVVCS